MLFPKALCAYAAQRGLFPMLPLVQRRGRSRILPLLLAATMMALPTFAQQFATVNITVHDPSGSAVTNARVSVRNVETGVSRTEVSDKLGMVAVPGLAAGQ
jgi:hypothetical protein